MESVRAGVLDVGYLRHGDPAEWPVVLLHGFPYDVHAYDQVSGPLAAAGAAVVVPWLRGYGPTRFADATTVRSGQQAALAHDLRDLIAALRLERPVVAGYDWGGRAACLVAALWPQLVGGLVSVGGYNVQDIAASGTPALPEHESAYWYQFYLHGERGRAGLAQYRAEFARLLWGQWSPRWAFTDEQFAASSGSFDNPDFLDVVVHSYRHRYALVAGDPAYEATERLIATQPRIGVPTVVLDSEFDGLGPPVAVSDHEQHFERIIGRRLVAAGHNLPQECPAEFVRAVLDVHDYA